MKVFIAIINIIYAHLRMSPSGTSCCCSCCLQSRGWWWSWPTDWSPENSTEASTLRWATEKALMVSKRGWKTYRNSLILSSLFKDCNDELVDLCCSGVLLLQSSMLPQIPTQFDFNIRHSLLTALTAGLAKSGLEAASSLFVDARLADAIGLQLRAWMPPSVCTQREELGRESNNK